MLLFLVKSVFNMLVMVIHSLFKTRKRLKIVGDKCCLSAFETDLSGLVNETQDTAIFIS